MQFLQTVQNPVLAPFAKMDFIIREIAKAMDLDPDKVTNNMTEATIQAEILKEFMASKPQPEQPLQEGQPQTPPQDAPAGVDVMDPTGAGGGTIGTGIAPQPGEQGFPGNTGEGEV